MSQQTVPLRQRLQREAELDYRLLQQGGLGEEPLFAANYASQAEQTAALIEAIAPIVNSDRSEPE
jgi:hypothetical protein